MKIAVTGYSGAGKSTLARTLGERLGCPVLHLDTVQFTPGWVERDRAEALALVEAFMEQESWVIDGNYAGFAYARRMEEADRIVVLDFPRRICLPRVLLRWLRNRGRTRADMADGCIEKVDLEFVLWVLWKGRTPERRARLAGLALRFPDKTAVLRRPGDVAAFLTRL